MEAADEHGITAGFMVPTQASTLVRDPDFDANKLRTWRKLSFAGAPMPDWVQRELKAKLPNLLLTQIYGQSEMGVIAVLRDWYLPGKLGAVGRQPYNVDIAVVDPQGRRSSPARSARSCRAATIIMLEYYNEPEQTKRLSSSSATAGAGPATSARSTQDGFVTLIDRSKDMIISGGENVYPKEIENALYEHPAVAECAVFGVPDDKFGEVPIAYVHPEERRKRRRGDADRALRAAACALQAAARGQVRRRFPEDADRQDPEEHPARALLEEQGEEDMSDRYAGYRRLKLEWPQERILRITMDSARQAQLCRCLDASGAGAESGATSTPIRSVSVRSSPAPARRSPAAAISIWSRR